MRYLEGLNDEQKEAVLATDGPVSVLAGAGSGKTRVLTTRIYHLINQNVVAENILAVTFTNKAAREMRARLTARLGDGAEMPLIATFHGLGRVLLEEHGRALGIPRFFSIFDRSDSERAIKNILKDMGVDPKEVPPRAILARISRAKGEGATAADFREKHAREGFRTRLAADVWEKYDMILAKEKSLDFDDLISLPVRLLEENVEVRAEITNRFRYIHVDEYQDTNELQGRLVTILAEKHRNIFVVGDIDQTIYTWRGATIDNLLFFENVYPDAKTIVLEKNYRSSGTIVALANAIIDRNKNRKKKISRAVKEAGDPVLVFMAPNAEQEAAWIAQKTRRLLEEGTPAGEIAALFRTNFQSRALEEAFLRAHIPYRLLGTRFFDRKEVKDVLAWMRLALLPSREADRIRAVQAPPRGIGKVTLGKLAAGQRDMLRPSERAKVEAFEKCVAELSAAAQKERPSVFVRHVIDTSGLAATLAKGGEDDQERLENIRELATLATRYDGESGPGAIAALLADAALASDQDELDREPGEGRVSLMTVHAAKGLEFDTVFVAGLEEGLFPHEGMGNDENRDEEEERRLFYVAVTRARKNLILTLARVRRLYGTDYVQEPSSFLHDIETRYVRYEHAEEESVIYV